MLPTGLWPLQQSKEQNKWRSAEILHISLAPVKAWQRLHLSVFPNTEVYLSDEARCCDIKQACISGALRAEAMHLHEMLCKYHRHAAPAEKWHKKPGGRGAARLDGIKDGDYHCWQASDVKYTIQKCRNAICIYSRRFSHTLRRHFTAGL